MTLTMRNCFRVRTPSCTRDYRFHYVSCTQSQTRDYHQGGQTGVCACGCVIDN